jgi:hypothetical protein
MNGRAAAAHLRMHTHARTHARQHCTYFLTHVEFPLDDCSSCQLVGSSKLVLLIDRINPDKLRPVYFARPVCCCRLPVARERASIAGYIRITIARGFSTEHAPLYAPFITRTCPAVRDAHFHHFLNQQYDQAGSTRTGSIRSVLSRRHLVAAASSSSSSSSTAAVIRMTHQNHRQQPHTHAHSNS